MSADHIHRVKNIHLVKSASWNCVFVRYSASLLSPWLSIHPFSPSAVEVLHFSCLNGLKGQRGGCGGLFI